MKIPFGIQLTDEHMHYKLGAHNKVFYWCGMSWMLSTKTAAWLGKKIKAAANEK